MRLLLDTDTLLWWLTDDASLSATARKHIARANNTVLVSAVSAWEIATKAGLGKLPGAEDLAADFSGFLVRSVSTRCPFPSNMASVQGFCPDHPRTHLIECLRRKARRSLS